eukprot:82232-Pleurochrysis_carterae.AAC.3
MTTSSFVKVGCWILAFGFHAVPFSGRPVAATSRTSLGVAVAPLVRACVKPAAPAFYLKAGTAAAQKWQLRFPSTPPQTSKMSTADEIFSTIGSTRTSTLLWLAD